MTAILFENELSNLGVKSVCVGELEATLSLCSMCFDPGFRRRREVVGKLADLQSLGGWLAGSNEVCSVDLPCVPMFVVVQLQPIK